MEKQIKVLIIEPSRLLSDLILLALTRSGMTPILCTDTSMVRPLLIEHIPDILLVDTLLPGINGLDLVSELNAESYLSRTKVFILSSLGYPEIVQKAARIGAADFLVKPLDTDLLVARILRSMTKTG
ncbi:MAG: response regulator [Chloroflexota bacterium]